VITDEALVTHTSVTTGFLDDLIRTILEGSDAGSTKGVEEFGAREARHARHPSLRKQL
jgi:hypothetical protein